MPKVIVMVYTTLRAKLGFSKTELSGETVNDLILALCELKKPEAAQLLLTPAGHLKSHFVLTLNSEILDNRKLAVVKVSSGDILHIFPPVSGG